MKQVFLLRHALAEDRELFSETGLDDSLRPLIPRGKKKLRHLVRALSSEFSDIDLLVTSPLLRAKETALIVKEICRLERMEEAIELSPEFSPELFFSWLEAHSSEFEKVMLVGHEPWLGDFAGQLLGLEPGSKAIRFKKSGAAAFKMHSWNRGGGELRWLVQRALFKQPLLPVVGGK